MPSAASAWLTELQTKGYCIIRDAIDRSLVDALNADLDPVFEATPFCDGDFYGRRTKRFGSLLKRSSLADRLVRNAQVLDLAGTILSPFCDRMNLNLTQAIEIHPGAPTQYPHRDQDMWQGTNGGLEYLVNVMWPLSRFTAENGATTIWPKDREPSDQGSISGSQAIAAEMEPGSVLLFLGSTLHCGGGNTSNEIRRGLIVSYCLGWLKPFENQWLVYPPEVARDFEPDLAALVGYAQHRPNLGNVEGQCPSMLLKPQRPSHPAATDALRPDQAEALAQFVEGGSRL
jgi:ectoine hydroxylase-related dioxygenase (phytanoyl-CoA dioxygenase family)